MNEQRIMRIMYRVERTRNLIAIDIFIGKKRMVKMETEWLRSQKVPRVGSDGIDMIFTDAPKSTVVPLLYNIILLSCHCAFNYVSYYKIILSLYDYNLWSTGLRGNKTANL